MQITVQMRGRDAASATHTSPTSPGSAPADTASTLLYQHADHLTTRVTTDNAGTLSNQQAHYPYGENWYATGTADPSVKRKFTSYRKETDSSLASGQINYAIARYHGARIGRFQMADPNQGYVGNPQRLNRYAYVLADATNRSDPSGQDQCEMPLDIFLIYNLPWVGLGDEPPPIVNPYAFGGSPGYCYGGVFSEPQTGPVCVTPATPTLMFVNSTHPPTAVLGCAVPSEGGKGACDYYKQNCKQYDCKYDCGDGLQYCRHPRLNPCFTFAKEKTIKQVRQCLINEDRSARASSENWAKARAHCVKRSKIVEYHRSCFDRFAFSKECFPTWWIFDNDGD